MKKTSRRSFGKQLTGAMAALPIASLVMNESISGQVKPKTPRVASDQSAFKEHDTPPPVLLMQGSFIIETAEGSFDESVTMGGRKKYRRHPKQKTKVHLAHVKILDGSGEILYRNDNIMDDPTHLPMDLRLAVTTEDGLVNVASVGNNFEIDAPGDKKLEKVDPVTHPEDQPMGSKRLARFRYRDDPSGTQHRITGVKVSKGASMALFEISDLTDLASKGDELRIMVWLEET